MLQWLSPINRLVEIPANRGRPVLCLFGGPVVSVDGRRIEVPEASKRLLVFVSLHHGRVDRRYAAGALWPSADDTRAAGNLRSSLWRLNGPGPPLVCADKFALAMCDEVVVDSQLATEWAGRLVAGCPRAEDLMVCPWGLGGLDLLPGWYDDWALIERERVRQRMLHGLEALSRELVRIGRCAQAVEAAMMAVTAEPLRESAQRALIEAHLAEGNWVEGRRGYDAYRQLLERELGTEPAPELSQLIQPAAGRGVGRAGARHPDFGC